MKPRTYAYDEYADYLLYQRLAKREKNPHNREMLERLSAQELGHYKFWARFEPGYVPKVNPLFLALFFAMRYVLGLTFTIKFLERHEFRVVEEYKRALSQIPEEHREELATLIRDEEEHENFFISQLKEKVIQYIGFIALGLADAIVEITGVHAGFLGVTGSTLVAGISGLIVGFAAAISMGSAAYIQAKQDVQRSPFLSAIATGISYIVSVVMLALPYFLTPDMATAFLVSVVVGVLMIALLTFYSAVVFDRRFWREFLEATGLMLGTAVATFFVGKLLGRVFGIEGVITH